MQPNERLLCLDVFHYCEILFAVFTVSGLPLVAGFFFSRIKGISQNNFWLEAFCILVHLHLPFTKGVWSGIGCRGGPAAASGALSVPTFLAAAPLRLPPCLQCNSAAVSSCAALSTMTYHLSRCSVHRPKQAGMLQRNTVGSAEKYSEAELRNT